MEVNCRCTCWLGTLPSVFLGVGHRYIFPSNLPKCLKWLQKALFIVGLGLFLTFSSHAHTTKSILKVNTTNIFLRSNTLRPKTFSGLTPARQKFFSRVAHMTNSFSGRRHPKISSGRTYDQNLSQIEHIRTFPQVEHMTKIFLTSNTRPNIILGSNTVATTVRLRLNKLQKYYPEVEHSIKSFSCRNVQTN